MAENDFTRAYERDQKAKAGEAAKARREEAKAAEAAAAKAAKAERFLTGSGGSASAAHDEAKARLRDANLELLRSRKADSDARAARETPAQDAGPSGEDAGPMDPGVAAGQRGQRDFAAGMQLIAEAGKTRSVTSANPTYGAVKTLTDTMGTGAQREGRFVGVRPRETVAAPEQAPASTPAPVQVVVQTSPQEPTAAPASSGRAVPAGATPAAAPGKVPARLPSEAAPLEGEPPADESPEEEIARLEREAMTQTPEELAAQAEADYGGDPVDAVATGEMLDRKVAQNDEKLGVLQEQMNAAEGLSQAKVDLAQEEASALDEAAAQQRAAYEESQRVEAEQRATVEAQLQARKEAAQAVQAATDRFTAEQPLDAASVGKNMGLGRKLLFIVGAAAGGWGGTSKALDSLRSTIAQEVDDHEAKIAKLGANVDAAKGNSSEAANVYQDVLAQVGDARQARAITEMARLQQIEGAFKARLASEGVNVLSAEQEAFLTGLQEEIAGKQAKIDIQAAKNPRTITTAKSIYSKSQREAMKLGGKAMLASGVKGIESGEEYGQKAALQGMDNAAKAQVAGEKLASTKEDKIATQAATFGHAIAKPSKSLMILEDILASDDIAGYGFIEGLPTPGKSRTDAAIDRFINFSLRDESGGAITDDEYVNAKDRLMRGVSYGGEARLRENMKAEARIIRQGIIAEERALSPEVRAYYRRNKNNPDFASEWTGGTGDSVVEEDQ